MPSVIVTNIVFLVETEERMEALKVGESQMFVETKVTPDRCQTLAISGSMTGDANQAESLACKRGWPSQVKLNRPSVNCLGNSARISQLIGDGKQEGKKGSSSQFGRLSSEEKFTTLFYGFESQLAVHIKDAPIHSASSSLVAHGVEAGLL
ncbi:unnamed protein product [Litomosoides sigmodontis]|uniref:Uncharacterized protein n=1 Tax=Litomosoides sigmodontis TaxID=42156 RepID=A0A3P6SUJ1_LITSI|nr:unnamed protein product [Litomosoides sigmodontis]